MLIFEEYLFEKEMEWQSKRLEEMPYYYWELYQERPHLLTDWFKQWTHGKESAH